MKKKLHALWLWLEKYERHVSSFALLCGFVIDALTLKRVDLLFENLALMSYFVIIVVGITVFNIIDVRRYTGKVADKLSYILPLMIQFAFGGLFSGFTIFYYRSGSLAASWPFIIILVGLLLGNELFRKHYARLVFQITVFFASLFFFTIFFVPVLIDSIGPWVFILSGLTALGLTALFILILSYLIPERVAKHKDILGYSIVSVFLVINILYFTNLIPPIPLSLKDAGVYHSLVVREAGYVVSEEKRSYLDRLQMFKNVHVTEGTPLYVYSAVFAPTNITTEVVHHWRHFDDTIDRWVSVNRIPYTIAGGSDRGHRGYSMKMNLAPGEWAVDVETPRGQVIGRILFDIIYVDKVPELTEKIL